MKEISLPELGEGITSVEISGVSVNVGDKISIDDILIVVETDKASMEIPATEAGEIDKLHVEVGGSIAPGEPIVSLSFPNNTNDINHDSEPIVTENEELSKSNPQKTIIENTNDVAAVTESSQDVVEENDLGKIKSASPSVRRFAREMGCNLDDIRGSGPKGRITKEDVQNYVSDYLNKPKSVDNSEEVLVDSVQKKINVEKSQEIDFDQWGYTRKISLNKIKRITGQRLQDSWQNIPHVTQFDKADITQLDKLRKSLKSINKNKNLKVSHIPFFMKAVVRVLQKMPEFNSSLSTDGKELIMKSFINIGIAVDTPNGLVVPVIKNVDKKSIKKLTIELTQVSEKARLGKLTPSEMQGGCFTISSLGGFGGTYFTPIINPPEVAIMGISRMQVEPVYADKKFKARKMLPFSLSYDHRVIDGVSAVKFTRMFADILEKIKPI